MGYIKWKKKLEYFGVYLFFREVKKIKIIFFKKKKERERK
jgi:hypothetical protein